MVCIIMTENKNPLTMTEVRTTCASAIAATLTLLAKQKKIDLTDVGFTVNAILSTDITIEIPPNPEMGDIGIPMFSFAKAFRMGPPQIAGEISRMVQNDCEAAELGVFSAAGPYVNVKLNKTLISKIVLTKILEQGENYGNFDDTGKKPLSGKRVMIEFSSPNTNKPLHLGHLRNDALGESCSRLLKTAGADVYKVNIINDRGVHICKSMLAYQKFHADKGDTPENLGIKSDRFVGDCYVEYNNYSTKNPEAEAEAQNLLVEWEKGNDDVRELWRTMNDWAISGVKQTYERTGISFDKFYFESETYLKGKEEILQGLNDGIFYKEEDGSVWVDLAEINLDKKVLLRKDGTALYMTQDIGTAIYRHTDWDFNQLVYVVGNEQNYHFTVLFYILKKLGYDWADQLYHLSYGMVNLPEGKMKSREGTVVDADDLIDALRDGAIEEINEKGRENAVGDVGEVGEKVALGALHYFLLQTSPTKDMTFNPKESLSFNGNTGPYLQYMGARLSSILRKAQETGLADSSIESNVALLKDDAEWELIKTLEVFPKTVQRAAENLDPSLIANYTYDVSKAFSRFYHDCPIIAAENDVLKITRLSLAKSTLIVLRNALNLILVPFLETM